MGKIFIMKKTKLTIAIGIPAHNEEANIGILLDCISNQKLDTNYCLKNVYVACDGCSDNTAKFAIQKSKIDQRVKVIDDGQRLGQSGRLNQFYQNVTEDIFITFDADTLLDNDSVVNEIAKHFDDLKVVLVGGNDTPNKPRNLIEKIGAVWVLSWYKMRYRLNNGDTVHNHKGCVSAGRVSFLKKLKIPKEVFANDDYLYFSCKKLEYKFKFAEKAVVYYRIPSTFNEYMTQTTRFLNLKHRIADHFGNWVYDEYHVPLQNKLYGLISTFLLHPILMTLAVVLQIFQRLAKGYYTEKYSGVSWKEIKSSKK
jgi:cellulose synthase/poly-beta-1,6-N-acetylglucosamine synthase-like glycosyltransferase